MLQAHITRTGTEAKPGVEALLDAVGAGRECAGLYLSGGYGLLAAGVVARDLLDTGDGSGNQDDRSDHKDEDTEIEALGGGGLR